MPTQESGSVYDHKGQYEFSRRSGSGIVECIVKGEITIPADYLERNKSGFNNEGIAEWVVLDILSNGIFDNRICQLTGQRVLMVWKAEGRSKGG
jgi:hypothetical protein